MPSFSQRDGLDLDGLTFRQDYMPDAKARQALVSLLQDTFGIDVGLLQGLGGFDPGSMPFAYFDGDGTCVANFSAFSMPLMIDGRVVRVAGYQSGAVRPQWRGRGLYRDLMRKAFAWSARQGFELDMLLTDKPALYEPYGFRCIPQYRFAGPLPVYGAATHKARRLSLASPADLILAKRLLRERTPVSKLFSVVAQAEMFLLNASLDVNITLSVLDEDAIIAWTMGDDGCFQLLDVAAPVIPSMDMLLSSLGVRAERIEVYFPIDRLEWQGTPQPFPSDTALMIRGSALDGFPSPVMLSPLAQF